MMVLLLALACGPKPPPPVFTDEPPSIERPDLVEIPERADGDCLEILPLTPTGTAPGCRGLIVPPMRFAEMLRAESLAVFYEERLRICAEYRDRDRRYCEQIAGERWTYGEAFRTDLRWQKVATIAAFVGGTFFGGAVAVGIVRAAQ